MKLVLLIMMFSLSACAARPPLAELEAEAQISGDWSAVEKHRRMDKAMNRVQGDDPCYNGYILVCHTKAEREECGCVSPLDRGLRQ